MKKKLLTIALAVVLALGCFAGLIACGNPAAPDADSVKGEKVADATAFAAAFDFSKVTNASMKMVMNQKTGEEEYSSEAILYMDGDKYYQKATYTNGKNEDGTPNTKTQEAYLAKEGETYYNYEYDEEAGKWYKEAIKMDGFDISEYFEDYSTTLIAAYAALEYNEEKNAYVYSVDIPGSMFQEATTMEMEVKIVDGKLAVLKVVNGTTTVTIQFYNINKTSVSLPSAELVSEDAE